MLKIADILELRLEEFAEMESRDQGKPVWLARTVEIPRAVYNFRFFATSVLHELNRYLTYLFTIYLIQADGSKHLDSKF